jgi:hypothetical protein
MRWNTFLSCLLLLGTPSLATASTQNEAAQSFAERVPTPVLDVLYVRPFTLAKGYRFTWSPEQPVVDSGVLVVVRVDPELVVPRNEAEPILYAGERTVERLNAGHLSGHVIAIIPGTFDPATEPIWFGRPGLPAHVTPKTIQSELTLVRENLRLVPQETLAGVTQPLLEAPDLAALLRGEIAELVLQYAPQESHLARKWRLPEAKAEPDPARPVREGPDG